MVTVDDVDVVCGGGIFEFPYGSALVIRVEEFKVKESCGVELISMQ